MTDKSETEKTEYESATATGAASAPALGGKAASNGRDSDGQDSSGSIPEAVRAPDRPPSPADDSAPNAPSFGENSSAQIPAHELERLTQDIIAALKTVYDPEIPSDIYEIGLIYSVDIDENRMVDIVMTVTAPGCPVAGEMPIWVENAVSAVEGVSGVQVEMVFDPPWTPQRLSEEAQIALGWYV